MAAAPEIRAVKAKSCANPFVDNALETTRPKAPVKLVFPRVFPPMSVSSCTAHADPHDDERPGACIHPLGSRLSGHGWRESPRHFVGTGNTGEEYAHHLDNAVVLDTADPAEAAWWITYFAAHPAEQAQLRAGARETAERFVWDRVLDQLLTRVHMLATPGR